MDRAARPLPRRSAISSDGCRSANPLWGAPRIHGELLMLGLDIAEPTVSKYMVRARTPPSQTWKHLPPPITSRPWSPIDFFTVPTATFRILYVFVVLSHSGDGVVHFNVTDRPHRPSGRRGS